MTDDDYDALSQKQLASIKRDTRISFEDAAFRATHKVMAELEQENSVTDRELMRQVLDAYGYASRLAVALWEQHYKDVAPQWKPLDDLMGVLTQIDNMTSGLTRLAQPETPDVTPEVTPYVIDCPRCGHCCPQWVGLTDEEIKEIIGPWGDTPIKGYTRKLFDQIENKLKEKNT